MSRVGPVPWGRGGSCYSGIVARYGILEKVNYEKVSVQPRNEILSLNLSCLFVLCSLLALMRFRFPACNTREGHGVDNREFLIRLRTGARGGHTRARQYI